MPSVRMSAARAAAVLQAGGPAQRVGTLRKLWRFLRDPGVATWKKLAGAAAVAYVIWPFDLIPDTIPVLGWLDDVGVLAAVALFLVREVRRHERTLEAAAGIPVPDSDPPQP
jgi:uncharacterized membrane protein YkvA (DUF1232 family)